MLNKKQNKVVEIVIKLLAVVLILGQTSFLERAFADEDEGAKYPEEVKSLPISQETVTVENIKKINENEKKTGGESIGPRKGFLRDAGAFKVEMKTSKQGIDIYVVNSNATLPITESSRVDGQIYIEKREYELKFRAVNAQKKFFSPWPTQLKHEEVIGKEISVVILAVRDKLIGAPVLYKLEKLY